MKILKTYFVLTLIVISFFIFGSRIARAECDSYLCDGTSPCVAPCDTCGWCPTIAPSAEGIKNPVVGKFGSGEGASILAELIANALKITFSLSGLVLLGMLILGAYDWMTSSGNQEVFTRAQRKITNALIGFVIYMSVFAIINYLLPALGIDLNILKITWPTATP